VNKLVNRTGDWLVQCSLWSSGSLLTSQPDTVNTILLCTVIQNNTKGTSKRARCRNFW
ncbi:hypothetical protein BgiMline_026904, partial [Biomphalaria glabrata]